MMPSEQKLIQQHVFELEREGYITRTFRRLDPERQQAVLTAILEEAIEKGPAELNIKRVAERAGVSVGALYTYFENREKLIDFVVQLGKRMVNELLEIRRAQLVNLPLAEGLFHYLSGGQELNRLYRNLQSFFAQAAYRSESEPGKQIVGYTAEMMCSLVRDMVTNAIARGEVRLDIDVDAVVRVIHGLSVVYADSQLFPNLNTYFRMSDDQVSAERTLKALIVLVLDGIGT